MNIFADPAQGGNIPWGELSAEIRRRLTAEGIVSATEGLAPSRRRQRSIFGIALSMAPAIDAAAAPRVAT
jgi:hypothetical protein